MSGSLSNCLVRSKVSGLNVANSVVYLASEDVGANFSLQGLDSLRRVA